jgi:protein gp37
VIKKELIMKNTKIEWTEATWNPVVGCSKLSAGCKFCYAEVMARRLQAMGIKGYENGFKLTLMPERIDQPLKQKKPTKYFVCSMSDLFHPSIPGSFLDNIFATIWSSMRHTYQILSKRSVNMKDYFRVNVIPPNVWLGVSVENKKSKYRIGNLRDTPAEVRFISFEPLLEDLGEIDFKGIHWVIVGGESGNNARPMKRDWVLNILAQCTAQNVPFFFKQWGIYGEDGIKRSKKANGRLLNGATYDEYPVLD